MGGGGAAVVQDLSPIDFLPACFIAFLCHIHGQLMAQLYLGESRDRADERMQQNRKMEVWILLSAVRVTMMMRGPTRAECVHETEGNGVTHIYERFHLHMLLKYHLMALCWWMHAVEPQEAPCRSFNWPDQVCRGSTERRLHPRLQPHHALLNIRLNYS